ncbi:MAG: MipA/OmpV family protein [Sulfuricaulis sp.]
MNASSRRALCLLCTMLAVPEICAAQSTDDSTNAGLDGYLGAGALYMSRYTGGTRYETDPIPLAMIDYKETAYIHFDRAGVRMWSSQDKKMALGIAAEPRFGYHAEDGDRLVGMSTRRDAIEGGATFDWELQPLSLSVAYFTDWSRSSGGQSWRFTVDRSLVDRGPWDIDAYIDLDYADAKIARYYFGVRADESTAARPAYQPGAVLISTLGFSGAYKLNKSYALLFGSGLSSLGATAADSPIVERSTGITGYFGLGVIF